MSTRTRRFLRAVRAHLTTARYVLLAALIGSADVRVMRQAITVNDAAPRIQICDVSLLPECMKLRQVNGRYKKAGQTGRPALSCIVNSATADGDLLLLFVRLLLLRLPSQKLGAGLLQ